MAISWLPLALHSDATDALPIEIGHGGAVEGRLRRAGSAPTTSMSAEAQSLYESIDEVRIATVQCLTRTSSPSSQDLPERLARSTCFNGSRLPRKRSGKPVRCVHDTYPTIQPRLSPIL